MEYEIVIGLEIHAELSTKSKIFCSCSTAFGGKPNTQCCPICMGFPGVLPVLNRKAVEYAVKAGLSTNCTIPEYSKMDRKNYFYPDLPKAYQVSQFDLPLCINGFVNIETSNGIKKIRITRIHLEEDAGKLVHDQWETGSLIDYNRCGVPLIEIVSEPDLRSAEEVRVYLENIKSILEYIEVSDCKMQEGSLRADVNLSIRPYGQEKLGTRTEMKNLNSFKAIVRAIESEAARQKGILEEGGKVVQETRRWDDVKGCSYSMRSKEEAHDYRYFPEPDLLPIIVDNDWKEKLKAELPELPENRKKRYIEQLNLPSYDASILTASKTLAVFFEAALEKSGNAKATSNWIMGDVMRLIKEKQENIESEGEGEGKGEGKVQDKLESDDSMELGQIPISPENLAGIIKLVDAGKISSSIAKKVFEKVVATGQNPADIVRSEGLEVMNDEAYLLEIAKRIVKSNPQSVMDYLGGKEKALGFLVGQAMKETKGKGNPQVLNKMVRDAIQNYN